MSVSAQDIQNIIEGVALLTGGGYLVRINRPKQIAALQTQTIIAYEERLKVLELEHKDCQKQYEILEIKYQALKQQYDWLADLIKKSTIDQIIDGRERG